MQIVMKIIRINQLVHPHIERPIRESNLGVPLSKLTRIDNRVRTVHYNYILHCEHVDLSRSNTSSSSSFSRYSSAYYNGVVASAGFKSVSVDSSFLTPFAGELLNERGLELEIFYCSLFPS